MVGATKGWMGSAVAITPTSPVQIVDTIDWYDTEWGMVTMELSTDAEAELIAALDAAVAGAVVNVPSSKSVVISNFNLPRR